MTGKFADEDLARLRLPQSWQPFLNHFTLLLATKDSFWGQMTEYWSSMKIWTVCA
jgi:hypothetical protein